MIVSAFPATGKTYLTTHDRSGAMFDPDSSSWSWSEPGVRHPGWPGNYIVHVTRANDRGAVVLCSSHAEVRAALVEVEAYFVLVYPMPALRGEYVERLVQRGSPPGLVALIGQQWDDLIGSCEEQRGCAHLVLDTGQYLSDVIR